MCISASMLMAIQTGVQVISAISQGDQQAQQYEWQARQAAADAQAEREMGEVRADKVRKAGRRQQSEARAALAASGVETGSGTPIKIDQEIVRNAEADAQQELLSGNYRGQRMSAEAAGLSISGSNARTSGYMRAAGSLLNNADGLLKGWKAGSNRADLEAAAKQFAWD